MVIDAFVVQRTQADDYLYSVVWELHDDNRLLVIHENSETPQVMFPGPKYVRDKSAPAMFNRMKRFYRLKGELLV